MSEPILFDPLEEDVAQPFDVKIDGKIYPVGGPQRSVTTEMLGEVQEVAKGAEKDSDSLAKVLGILLRIPATTFEESDFRVLNLTSKWIQNKLMPTETEKKNDKKAKKKAKK